MKKKILCTICMRGNSKGIINKNLIKINGKPLLSYTIKTAINSKLFDEIVVSSDSLKILEASRKLHVKNLIKRPKKLATDFSGKIPAIRHALIETERRLKKKFDFIMDLDVTSPFRSVKDVIKSFNKFIKVKAENLVSVTLSRKNPYYNIVERKNSKIKLVKKLSYNILRRQDSPQTFDLNASIYIWKRDILLKKNNLFQNKTEIYEMSQNKSFDINDKADFEIANLFLKKRNKL